MLPDLIKLLLIKQFAVLERSLDSFLEIVQRVLVRLRKLKIGVVVTALEEVIRKSTKQVFYLDPQILFGKLAVRDSPHSVLACS